MSTSLQCLVCRVRLTTRDRTKFFAPVSGALTTSGARSAGARATDSVEGDILEEQEPIPICGEKSFFQFRRGCPSIRTAVYASFSSSPISLSSATSLAKEASISFSNSSPTTDSVSDVPDTEVPEPSDFLPFLTPFRR